MEEDDSIDAPQPRDADNIRYSDERTQAALRDVKAMSLFFIDGKFERAIEEALNTLVKCAEAINLLAGQPASDQSETFATFQETFLSENQETGSGIKDWLSSFARENRELLGRGFEEDFKSVHALAQNQNLRVGIAYSPKDVRTLIIKLSWMSHKLLLYSKKLRELITSREETQELGNTETRRSHRTGFSFLPSTKLLSDTPLTERT